MCIWFGIFCFPLIAIAAQGVIKVKGYFSEVQAIRQIEKNSNYVFFYDAADLDEVKRKNIDRSDPSSASPRLSRRGGS